MMDSDRGNMKENGKALRSVKDNAGGIKRIEGPVACVRQSLQNNDFKQTREVDVGVHWYYYI
jgi:hypothetical protein